MSDLREELDLANAKRDLVVFELAAALQILREIVESLPQCDQCHRPATKAWERGRERYCDGHGPMVRDYPRATPLRKAIALLARLHEKDAP